MSPTVRERGVSEPSWAGGGKQLRSWSEPEVPTVASSPKPETRRAALENSLTENKKEMQNKRNFMNFWKSNDWVLIFIDSTMKK